MAAHPDHVKTPVTEISDLCEIGLSYEFGDGVPIDLKRAKECYEKAIARGDANAYSALGAFYKGSLTPPDIKSAADCFMRGAELGDSDSMHQLAFLYENGDEAFPKDMALALHYYKAASNLNHPQATYELGACYEQGIGMPQNLALAFDYFTRAAHLGFDLAHNALGMLYEQGRDIVEPNLTKAIEHYKLATRAEKPEHKAHPFYHLGRLAENGIGIPVNFSQAILFYHEAAILNHPQAIEKISDLLFPAGERIVTDLSPFCVLAISYEEGIGNIKDLKIAKEYYEKAVEEGNAYACFRLGILHQHILTPPDLKTAIDYFQKGVGLGCPEAIYAMANLFEKGHDIIPQDDLYALRLYIEAARQNHSYALFRLGSYFENGRGTTKSNQLAINCYYEAGKLGCSEAYDMLAHCYELGRLTIQDSEKAKEFTLAATQNKHLNSPYHFNTFNKAHMLYLVATVYDNGNVTPIDSEKAILLYAQAAALGGTEATDAYNVLKEKLKREEQARLILERKRKAEEREIKLLKKKIALAKEKKLAAEKRTAIEPLSSEFSKIYSHFMNTTPDHSITKRNLDESIESIKNIQELLLACNDILHSTPITPSTTLKAEKPEKMARKKSEIQTKIETLLTECQTLANSSLEAYKNYDTARKNFIKRYGENHFYLAAKFREADVRIASRLIDEYKKLFKTSEEQTKIIQENFSRISSISVIAHELKEKMERTKKGLVRLEESARLSVEALRSKEMAFSKKMSEKLLAIKKQVLESEQRKLDHKKQWEAQKEACRKRKEQETKTREEEYRQLAHETRRFQLFPAASASPTKPLSAPIKAAPAGLHAQIKGNKSTINTIKKYRTLTLDMKGQITVQTETEDEIKLLEQIISLTLVEEEKSTLETKMIERNALLGSLVSVMEMLKRIHGKTVFPSDMARHFRNVIFHGSKLFPEIGRDVKSNQEFNISVRNMVNEILIIVRTSDKENVCPNRTEWMLKTITSPLFHQIMNYRITPPTFEECTQQLALGEYEESCYQKVLGGNEKIMKAAQGLTYARFSTYFVALSKMVKNGTDEIRQKDYEALCKQFNCTVAKGRAFRHHR